MNDQIKLKTDLSAAVRYGKKDQYFDLINSYDISEEIVNGETLLHQAVFSNQHEIALDLIKRGIDVNKQDKKGITALQLVGMFPTDGNLKVAQRLIEAGAKLEIKDAYGNTPLWAAVIFPKKNYELIELLIKAGADPNSENKVGRSPLEMAKQFNDIKLINILERNKQSK